MDTTFKPMLAAAALLGGCSSQQLYGAGQAWQKQECNRIANVQERARCLASTRNSYEDYKRKSEAAKRQP